MRTLVVLLMMVPLLAGCLGGESGEDPVQAPVTPLVEDDIEVPAGAELAAITNGFALTWDEAIFPFVQTVTVPEHATMVRAVANSTATSISIVNDDTGRRRCNNPSAEAFNLAFDYPKSCSGLTLVDEPGARWRVTFNGPASGNAVSAATPVPADLRIEFLAQARDGIAAQLRLEQIDKPTLELQETQVLRVPSFDGTELRVEVTLPEGAGPWPAIIESSPYNDDGARTTPASWEYFVQDWAKRGYAVVAADVRGFADSGGCVEVWGANEQADQKFLVEWTASQGWSDGNVGFYGQSYVGTTPVEAAVQAPEALKAIIAVAPVINAYEDWHYGGVPNGEAALSPVSYQVLTDATPPRTDPLYLATTASNGLCDPTLVARANDPRATYTEFYEERDFKLRAGDVTAAVLYTQGFEDANVKGAMIPGWFNDLQSPKLGLFGHWLHQHPSRLDTEALMLGWFEEHLKGKDLGFSSLPAAVIEVDRDTQRLADAWPPREPVNTVLYPNFEGTGLAPQASDGSASIVLSPTGPVTLPGGAAATMVALTMPVEANMSLAGTATLHVQGRLEGAVNAYLGAALVEITDDGDRLLTMGQFNVAHRNGHDQYVPVTRGEVVGFDMPLRPTEHVVAAGSTVRLELFGVAPADATDPFGVGGVEFTFEGGADGTRLILPGVSLDEYTTIDFTATP